MHLNLRQRNDLFEAIEAAGLDPLQCDLRDEEELDSIVHRATGSGFSVWQEPNDMTLTGALNRRLHKTRMGDWRVSWSVQDGSNVGPITCPEFDGVITQAGKWAREVRYVSETPDQWAELSRISGIQTAIASAASAPFTAEEQFAIAARVKEIKQQARENPELTVGQVSGIEQKLDDLVEASKRVGKKDWLTMLYGAAFGMIVNDVVPAHVVQGIITTVVTSLGHILGLGGPPPSLPL